MQIQTNTGSNITGSEGLAAQAKTIVEGALAPFSDQITRVELHLSDENGPGFGVADRPRFGVEDKRCVMEARLEGRQPIAVTHQAATVEQAMDGAADKLKRSNREHARALGRSLKPAGVIPHVYESSFGNGSAWSNLRSSTRSRLSTSRGRGRGEQVKKLLMLVVVSSLAVACSSQKVPAEAAVNGLETAAAAAKPNIEQFAADRMAGVNDAVAAVRAKFDGGDYAGALADVQAATGVVTTAAEAAAARRAQLATDWAAYAGMPAQVGLIKSKVAELNAMRRLPRGMDRAKFDGVKSSLDSATALFAEASDAHDKGDLVVAVSKAKDATPIIESLMATLGISSKAT